MTTPTSLSLISESWVSQELSRERLKHPVGVWKSFLNGDSVEYLDFDVLSLAKPSVQAQQPRLVSCSPAVEWPPELCQSRTNPLFLQKVFEDTALPLRTPHFEIDVHENPRKPICHQQPCHVQNNLNPLSPPFRRSDWTSAHRLDHVDVPKCIKLSYLC